jgi:glycerol-3-phosphate dehydrogenase
MAAGPRRGTLASVARAGGHFDVIVLGGGVNGAGTARDLAMRGLAVLLLEKADFGVGASGHSSGMIHGGVRYMLTDRKVTALACRDSGWIQRIAPHLLFPIPFLMPFASKREGASLWERATYYAYETYFGAYDVFQPLKRGQPSARLAADELYALEPSLRPGLHGAITFDEWGIDAFRLCLLNVLSAERHGAEVHSWTEGRRILAEGGHVRGVVWRDALTGEEGEAFAPVVFNATGAWSPAFARRQGATVAMRPGKGVHLTLDRRWSNYGVLCTAIDGRQMFLMPHGHDSIIGTTDDDYAGDPDDLEATHDEVEYLLGAVERVVPAIRRARIVRAWCGLRTTLQEWGPNEDALSRDHRLLHGAAEGLDGLVSIVGGKLASYRAQSEEAADWILARLGRRPVACRTHEEPLPGGEAVPAPAALAAEHGLDGAVAARLVYRHGSRAIEVLRLVRDDPRLGAVICRSEGILAAEVIHSVRHEKVRRLQDLRRRLRLGVGACAGLDCARLAAQLAGRELDWTPEQIRAELGDLLDAGWRERRAVLAGSAVVQEELLRHAVGLAGVP